MALAGREGCRYKKCPRKAETSRRVQVKARMTTFSLTWVNLFVKTPTVKFIQGLASRAAPAQLHELRGHSELLIQRSRRSP